MLSYDSRFTISKLPEYVQGRPVVKGSGQIIFYRLTIFFKDVCALEQLIATWSPGFYVIWVPSVQGIYSHHISSRKW